MSVTYGRLAPRWLCRNMSIIWCSSFVSVSWEIYRAGRDSRKSEFCKNAVFIHPASINLHRELVSHLPKCSWMPQMAQMIFNCSDVALSWDFEKCVSSYLSADFILLFKTLVMKAVFLGETQETSKVLSVCISFVSRRNKWDIYIFISI